MLILQPVLAQQDSQSSQYMFNTLTFNPGVAGTSGMICATAMNRQQWVGFKGAPSTTLFNICAPVSLSFSLCIPEVLSVLCRSWMSRT